MTRMLFRDDPYGAEAQAIVTAHTEEGGVVLDESLFYPTGGGQPGDSGSLLWGAQSLPIATSVKGQGYDIVLVPSEPAALPAVGTAVTQRLDWARRHRHMRVHTALHLLSIVIPLPVTGGAISADKGRLDFAMPDAPPDRAEVEAALEALVDSDLAVTEHWITQAELDANPGLVKTMSVRPPAGAGRVRLIRIGQGARQVDLQPCGGTHVARTAEIGRLHLGKIENKGRQNRRVHLHLDD